MALVVDNLQTKPIFDLKDRNMIEATIICRILHCSRMREKCVTSWVSVELGLDVLN